MSQNQSVTIGITCFNARDTIGRAIASALAQDWSDVEVLIVDDASSDNSVAVVEAAIAGEPRARLIRLAENGGPSVARNALLAGARGDFIVFFDDDDESLPQRVRRQVEAIKVFEAQHGGLPVACYAGGERLYTNGYRKSLPAVGAKDIRPHGPAMADRMLFHHTVPGWDYGTGTPTCALMARTALFVQVGGFDPALRRVEDLDWAIRLALAGGWFIGTEETLFLQHATTGADKSYEHNLDAEVALVEKHADYLRSIRRYHLARNWPVLRYYHFKRDYLSFALQFLRIWLVNPLMATKHILATGPKRLAHERRMRAKS